MVSAMLCGPHVLAVQLGDVELFRGLSLVWMVRAAIDAQIAHLHPAERPARDHALHGLFQYALGIAALEDLARGVLLDVADIAGVLEVDLLLPLAAGQDRMRRVDDDDVVATI